MNSTCMPRSSRSCQVATSVMKMKRKVETAESSKNTVDQDISSKGKKKRKKQIKEEYDANETTSFEDAMDYSSGNADVSINDPQVSEGSKKKKKKKKKKTDTDEESILETGDEVDPVVIKTENPNGLIKDVWPKEKILKLLNNISEALPENDNLKYRSRMTKIDWNSISFECYSPEDCQAMWKCIQDKTRCFRVMKEIVIDAKEAIQQSSSVFYHGMVKDKHPEMPAKPLSSFMLFYMDTKDKITQENPGIGCPDLAKKVSELWKSLNAKKAEKYKLKAQKLRNEYDEKLAEFYEKHPEFIEEKRKKTKTNADSLGFEKPKSAFQLYYQSCREEAESLHSKSTGIEVLEKTKNKWKTMPEDCKVKWIEAAQKEEENYRERLKKYELEHPGFEMPTVKPLLTKNDRNILENISGRPKKPPSNAYSLYSQLMLQSNSLKKLPSKERLTEISRRWKALSQNEKDYYMSEVKKLQNIYKKEYNEFFNSLPLEKRAQEEEKNRIKKKKGQEKKVSVEPERPPTSIIEYFKMKNQNEWKKKNAKTNVDDMAKKKWRMLPKMVQNEYIVELKKINDKFLDDYAKFLQQCPPAQVMQFLLKFTEHKKKIDELEKIISNDGGNSEDD